MNERPFDLSLALALLAAGLAAALLADAAWKSVTGYRSRYAFSGDMAPGTPLARRVALIVLDGVRVDVAERMPALQALAARGVGGVATVGSPSLSNPARATLATGAWAEVHGVTNNGRFRPPETDSIFSLAREAGVPRAVFGGRFWKRAFPADMPPEALRSFDKELHDVESPDELIDWQTAVCGAMIPFLTEQREGLLVAALTAPDEAGHIWGGESREYRRTVLAADDCLGKLTAALDDGGTAFLVVSDHGHIHRRGQGGHGGSEPEVRRVPLALAGRGVGSGGGLEAELVDVAPTICALLGLPLPANNQGRVLRQALDVPPEVEAELDEREAEQRRFLSDRLPDRDRGMAAERRDRIPSVVVALLALTGAAVWAFRRLRGERGRLALALVAYGVVYTLLFWAFGLGYSLSAIVREEYVNSFFLRNLAASAAAFIAASAVLRFRRALILGVLLAAVAGLRVAGAHLETGLLMRGYLPDLDRALTAYLDLLQILAVGVAATIVSLIARKLAPNCPSGPHLGE